jgi:hypothetical protein
MIQRPKLVATFIWCITIIIVCTKGYGSEKITLKSIPLVEAPVIEKKVIKYHIDFVFDHCPKEYWLFYDVETERLVIEFFGVSIDTTSVEIKGTSVVSDLTVKNSTTDMALNGKGSRISMVMKEGWHYESSLPEDEENTLRLQLWMPLNPTKALNRKRKYIRIPIIVSSIALVVAGLIIILDQQLNH